MPSAWQGACRPASPARGWGFCCSSTVPQASCRMNSKQRNMIFPNCSQAAKLNDLCPLRTHALSGNACSSLSYYCMYMPFEEVGNYPVATEASHLSLDSCFHGPKEHRRAWQEGQNPVLLEISFLYRLQSWSSLTSCVIWQVSITASVATQCRALGTDGTGN